MSAGYSDKCSDLQTYWVRNTCVPCSMLWIKPGYEFTPNCGYVDDGGRRDSRSQKCREKSFNDGTRGMCRPCSSCPPGRPAVRPCNGTADTCCQGGQDCSEENGFTPTSAFSGPSTVPRPGPPGHVLWLAPIIVVVCIMVGVLSYFIYKNKRQYFKDKFAILHHRDVDEWEAVLSPQVQAAPLRMVLDDLDVLDELIILLDPESSGVKCTRHLASYCSFPSTWINYTYSMRDNKSPLKSVLEGVTTKHPDWTVGHLTQMLAEMGRNDAIIVLAKLKMNTDVA